VPVGRSGGGWSVWVWPRGLVQVMVLLLPRWAVQVVKVLLRWWNRHRVSRLQGQVAPSSVQDAAGVGELGEQVGEDVGA
jgi:hypothetical protein